MIEQLSFAFAELAIAPTQIVDFCPNFLSQSEADDRAKKQWHKKQN